MIDTSRTTRSSFRRLLAVLSAGALVLALSPFAGTAGAQPAPTARDTSEACEGAPDATFEDGPFDNDELNQALDCLFPEDPGYGVVNGFDEDQDGTPEYNPGGFVLRGRMASFVARTLEIQGTVDVNQDAENAFEDDDDFPEEHENNINGLNELDIYRGDSGQANARANIHRDQMASLIVRSLQEAGATLDSPAADPFPADDCGVHEDNVNRLAAAGVVQGDEQGSFNCDGNVTRSQMALFLVRSVDVLVDQDIVDNPYSPGESGTVVATDTDENTYEFATDDGTQVSADYDDTNDEFTVDGSDATMSAFEDALTVGDEITYVDDPDTSGVEDADQHDLTNVDTSQTSSGTIGNIDTSADSFDFIEPVSGVTLRTISDYSGEAYTVDGTTVSESDFEASLSEGDTLEITEDSAGDRTFHLTDESVNGTVSNVNTESDLVRIDALGDDPTSDQDDDYVYTLGTDTNEYTVDGSSASEGDFEDALDESDTLTYTRDGGTQTFALENATPSPTTGTVTEEITTDGDGGTVTVVNGGSDASFTYSADATFTVDGILSTEAEFEDALSAGDEVTYTPDDPDTSTDEESVTLSNQELSGQLADPQTDSDTYDVATTAGGTVYEDLDYTAAIFGGGDSYFVNGGSPVSEADFESALDAADLDSADTIRVVDGSTTEHRLTTDDVS